MSKGKKKPVAAGPQLDDDDALLEAAIAKADNERAEQETLADIQRAETEALADIKRAEAEALAKVESWMERSTTPPSLSIKELVERMNVMPTFAIMNDTDSGKRFVPMKFDEDDGEADVARAVCAFFTDPSEAKRSLGVAQQMCPDLNLVLGVMPFGNAFSLTVGWADAKGDKPFTIRGSPTLAKDMRSHLKSQLANEGLPSYWQIPVILCEQLYTDTVLPVFLTHAGLAATWTAAGKPGPPPTAITIIDLRLLVRTMLAPYTKTGMDWRHVRFVGSEVGSRVVQRGLDELDAAGGIGSGQASGDAQAMRTEEALNAAALEAARAREAAVREKADPEMHPPPLLADPPQNAPTPPPPMVSVQ